jgi:hypothetical protein
MKKILEAVGKDLNTVWKEWITKHPDTILTSDAVKKGLELLKQKAEALMNATDTGSTSQLPPDPAVLTGATRSLSRFLQRRRLLFLR